MEKNLKLIGTLFGQKMYIDMEGCDPRVFDHAERFWKEGQETAEKLRKIQEILKTQQLN